MHWYTDVIRRYADFGGRAGRPEFWWFQLANAIVYVVILVAGSVALGGLSRGELLGNLYSLAVLLPGLGVDLRRLHDTDRSGWWILLGLLPVVGGIVLIVFFAGAGTPGPNRYGPSPAPAAIGGRSAA